MMNRKNKGFTLIELLIVVAIIGIVAAIAIPNLLDAMNRARFKATQGDIRSVGEGVESYRVDNRGRVPLSAAGATGAAGFAAMAVIINAEDYIKNPPVEDGWGIPLTYDVWPATSRDYTIASPGSDEDMQGMDATIQVPYDAAMVVARESRNWTCNIAFQNGQFSWGACD